jgi:trans-AT polyketide synthase/acyltransferase/oxidoreductase domain-containing protein
MVLHVLPGRARALRGSVHSSELAVDAESITRALRDVERPLFAVMDRGRVALATSGTATLGTDGDLVAFVPACRPASLGDPRFAAAHGLRFNYVAGAMAGGIASVELVEAMGRAGYLGVYGAAGLGTAEIADAIERLATRMLDRPWAANLIHSPYEPAQEAETVELYLRRGVKRISASAYLDLTLPLVRYRTAGVREEDGRVVAPHRVIAKVSRVEVASKFLAPPPAGMLRELVARGDLDETQAELCRRIPMCDALTVEADSGGHTDNRPALALLPTRLALRDRLQREHAWATPCLVGAAGGIGTPHAVAAAFAMGAAYVLTGTVNQGCLESRTSDAVRAMLADAGQADVAMAPAADMFEMGVQLQVLRRGTMFPMRARKLWELYRAHESLDALPDSERASIERQIFRQPLPEVWAETRRYWDARDPRQVERAENDARHKMALVFRWYLGQASRWANSGVEDRRVDYQIWCGPAIGAFNEWVRGSFLEDWRARRAVPIAGNLLHGACVLQRVTSLRQQGVIVPEECIDVAPRELAALEGFSS